MPKLGTVTIDVWPRQHGAIKHTYMEVVQTALHEKRRTALVLLNPDLVADTQLLICDLIACGSPLKASDVVTKDHGIEVLAALPVGTHYDILFIIPSRGVIDWNAIMNYPLVGTEVKILHLYDQELQSYV